MKLKPFFNAALTCILIITSCSNPKKEDTPDQTEFKPVEVNNEYSLSIPEYMKEAKDLNDEASLQYQNIFKEVYVIVIDEDKQTFIDTFTDLDEYDSTKTPVENYRMVQLKGLEEGINVSNKTEPVAVEINALGAQQVQLDGNVEGINHEISYCFTFIEGKDKMYMIMAWTLKDRLKKYSKMFETMASSFKLL